MAQHKGGPLVSPQSWTVGGATSRQLWVFSSVPRAASDMGWRRHLLDCGCLIQLLIVGRTPGAKKGFDTPAKRGVWSSGGVWRFKLLIRLPEFSRVASLSQGSNVESQVRSQMLATEAPLDTRAAAEMKPSLELGEAVLTPAWEPSFAGR